jgi:hypothetical protein
MYIDKCIKLYILKNSHWKDKWISLCIIKQLYSAYLISCELHKMILFGKSNIAVIRITMLGIFLKKDGSYLEMLSNSYTYWDYGFINSPM